MTAKSRTIAIFVAIILIIFSIYLSAPLHAEDDENLAVRLAAQVENLTRRVELLEEIREAQGAHNLPDGSCSLLQMDPAGRFALLQKPTMLHHLRQFDAFPVAHKLRHVRHDPESGLTYYSVRNLA